jgi:hypothetical protein
MSDKMNDKMADERRAAMGSPPKCCTRQPVADCSSRPLFFLCRGMRGWTSAMTTLGANPPQRTGWPSPKDPGVNANIDYP